MRPARNHLKPFALALALGPGLMPGSATASSAVQVPLGARALAMGGAYSSIADDATASYWNPAGLPWIGHQEITGHHANLYGSGLKDDFAAFVLPLSPHHAAAIDWYRSGFRDSELDFGENRIDLAYGFKAAPFLSAGVTAKYLTRSTALDGVAIRRGHGVGADFGLMLVPHDRVRLGLTLQDAFDTRLAYTIGDGSVLAYPRNLRLGAAYRPWKQATVALDVDGRYHVGAEYQVMPQLALRAGLQDDPDATDGLTTSFGAGIAYGVLRFDYARVDHPVLGSTNHFSVSMGFNFNPARIRIERIEPGDVFGSLYKSYARDSFGVVQVRNLDDQAITATIHTHVPELMDSPSSQVVVLRPRALAEIPLTAVLGERAMETRGDRPVQVEVSATYQSRRLPRTEKASARFIAYAPGAIDWSAGVPQAAAFVTIHDPVVAAVARDAARTAADRPAEPGILNLVRAAAIFDALGALGVTYVPDPKNPYSRMSAIPRAVDTISYPRQTLARRTGDCDDTSVLYAALLGNVGIETQFVDVPEHLFVLVDTGVRERNRLSLALAEDRTVVHAGRVWIPVETTALEEGFARAWAEGAVTFASSAGRGRLSLVDVREAQSRYEPADLRGEPGLPAPLETTDLGSRLDRDLATIHGWRDAFLAERYGDTRQRLEASAEALNEIAHMHYLAGQFEQARMRLELALPREDHPARTHNNLGNVLVARGEVEQALGHYASATAAVDADGGPWLNLGLLRHAVGDSVGGDLALAHGITRSGGYEQACRLLGLGPDAGGDREGGQKLSADETRQILRAAMLKVPAPAADSTRRAPARTTPPPRWTSRVAAGRAGVSALTDLLYWKP